MSTSIFISHSHKDKQEARQLANDLQRIGLNIWIDEAELNIGDSLEEKISSVISEIDYLAVVLTNNSIASDWVNKEVKLALKGENQFKKIKVLPLLFEECNPPTFLDHKLFGDFTTKTQYYLSFIQLSKRFDINYNRAVLVNPEKRFQQILSNPNYKNLELSIRLGNEDNSGLDFFVESDQAPLLDTIDFIKTCFIDSNWRNYELYLLCQLLAIVVEKYNVGQEILLDFIASISLNDSIRKAIHHAVSVKHSLDVSYQTWAHEVHMALKDDQLYCFYSTQMMRYKFLIENDEGFLDKSVNYLLFPDRGPSNLNFDTFSCLIGEAPLEKVYPLVKRVIFWINKGYFDKVVYNEKDKADYSTEIFYRILSRHDENTNFKEIIDRNFDRLRSFVKEGAKKEITINHLWNIFTEKYRNIHRIQELLEVAYSSYYTDEENDFFDALISYYRDVEKHDSYHIPDRKYYDDVITAISKINQP